MSIVFVNIGVESSTVRRGQKSTQLWSAVLHHQGTFKESTMNPASVLGFGSFNSEIHLNGPLSWAPLI